MIRVVRPNGTTIQCDTEEDLQMVLRVDTSLAADVVARSFASATLTSVPPAQAPASQMPASRGLKLDDEMRRVLVFLGNHKQISSEDVQKRLTLTAKESGKILLRLSVELKRATGQSLDTYFKRSKSYKGGRKTKVYSRTPQGVQLIRDIQA